MGTGTSWTAEHLELLQASPFRKSFFPIDEIQNSLKSRKSIPEQFFYQQQTFKRSERRGKVVYEQAKKMPFSNHKGPLR